MTPPRVVFDTNVLVSALVFASGAPQQLHHAWLLGLCRPLASRETAAELVRVLQYPKFKLTPEEQEELLADLLPYSEIVRIPRRLTGIPKCRDLDDAIFLQLAAAGHADYLVSGDKDLLSLASAFHIPIVTPRGLLAVLETVG